MSQGHCGRPRKNEAPKKSGMKPEVEGGVVLRIATNCAAHMLYRTNLNADIHLAEL